MNDQAIKNQLRKFSLYGLFKNLKFFDPFLWVYLASNGLDLTKIGLLIAIREVTIYLFEIPSGVFADKYGKKTELIICFLFYIISFILFFVGGSFIIFVFAFVMFGFGEALRSGTHKAMIMQFLDHNEIKEDNSKIYGLTRSYSMIGSAISSLLSVGFVIVLPNLRLLFLFSIVPYIADLLLVLSYPSYLNEKEGSSITFKDFLKGISVVLIYTLKENRIRRTLIDSASYNAIFKSVKDYIQPIMISFMIGITFFEHLDSDGTNKVLLGLIYALIFVVSSITSKNSYKALSFGKRDNILSITWVFLTIVFVVLGALCNSWVFIILLFIIIYVIQNVRKPIMVEKIGDISDKDKRASVLSVESQMTSLIIIVLAPTLGFIYDKFGVNYVFFTLAILSFMFLIYERLSAIKKVG